MGNKMTFRRKPWNNRASLRIYNPKALAAREKSVHRNTKDDYYIEKPYQPIENYESSIEQNLKKVKPGQKLFDQATSNLCSSSKTLSTDENVDMLPSMELNEHELVMEHISASKVSGHLQQSSSKRGSATSSPDYRRSLVSASSSEAPNDAESVIEYQRSEWSDDEDDEIPETAATHMDLNKLDKRHIPNLKKLVDCNFNVRGIYIPYEDQKAIRELVENIRNEQLKHAEELSL